MFEWMWIGTTSAAVFLVSFALVQWLSAKRERVRRRRQLERAGDELDDSTPDLVLGAMTPALAGQLPILGAEKRKEILAELHQAGLYRSSALEEFAAVRAVLVILPLLFTGLLALLVDRPHAMPVIMGGLCVAALGFSVPRVYINLMARGRQREIEKGLPVAVDLLALGLLAGQNVMLALERVCGDIRSAFPHLARELQIVRQQAELNTLPNALVQLADRVLIPEVRNLVIILTQSQHQGTDIAPALMEFSNSFRSSLRQQADRRANQASFWLVFPSIFFLWAPAFAALLAPIAFDFRAKREVSRRISAENRQETARLDRQSAQPAAQ